MGKGDKDEMERIKEARETWETTYLKDELEKREEWKKDFKTNSSISVNRVYTPLDLKSRRWSYQE